ncbi:hypothetical protein GEMRC1_000236 [Eukaryota sp. GEM-RC1]
MLFLRQFVCNLLAIEVSRSIPHFSQSNGLVERRHRDVLQSLRRLLVDFNEEHIVVKLLDRFNTPEGEYCTVLWFGGDTSSVPTKDIKNTKAYNEFVKIVNLDLFGNSRNGSSNNNTKLKRTSSKSTPKTSSKVKTPVAKRTSSSKGE